MKTLLLLSLALLLPCSGIKAEEDPIQELRSKAKIPVERALTITAIPMFKREAITEDTFWTRLELRADDEIKTLRWPDDAPKPEFFQSGKVYTFELLEGEYHDSRSNPPRVNWLVEIHRIKDGDKLIYDAAVCATHQQQMKREVTPVMYGLFTPPPGYRKAKKTFPNTGEGSGGCVVDPERMWTHGWVCPECKKNKEAWETKQRTQP